MSREHELKCWPSAFEGLKSGLKTFEIRVNDRDYQAGDVLVLSRWNPRGWYEDDAGERINYPDTSISFGDTAADWCNADERVARLRMHVAYMVQGVFGLPPGLCVMAVVPESDGSKP